MHDTHSVIDSFRDAMRQQGIVTDDVIVPDGTLRRFHVDGDRKGAENGWYILHMDDRPAGQFGCNKRFGPDERFSWSMKTTGSKPLSPEERQAMNERIEHQRAEKAQKEAARRAEAAERAKALWDAARPVEDHPYLERKAVRSHGLRVGPWEKVNRDTGEVWRVCDDALLIPMCDRSKNLHSLQAIFPSKLMNNGTRDKDYLKDGEKRGVFHPIGKPQKHNGQTVFVLAEGYATGATIHEATGHLVLVCFDAVNLPVVAQAIRERQPAAIILIAADNDQWTEQPVKNPGVHYARKAAEAVGGLVAVPPIPADAEGLTDFNDYGLAEGNEAVATVIADALDGKAHDPMAEDAQQDDSQEPPGDEPPPLMDPYDAGQSMQEAAPEPPPEKSEKSESEDEIEDDLIANDYFTLLGYDGGHYFIFSFEKRQVLTITKRDLTDAGLIELAPVNWWEERFPGSQGGIDKKSALNWMFRQANRRGIYDPRRIRGRGAWRDNGRLVYHHGSHLTVDGVLTDITKLRSGYVYPMARTLPMPAEQELTDQEGQNLTKIASMVRWSKPASAALMCGFVMLAPVCGALKWRPHIWITGGAGSGKTTIQSMFVAGLIGNDIGQYYQGNSTEPGIRQELRGDALPVLLDEAESNKESERKRIESILSLIRQASSDTQARTVKGSAGGDSMAFHIRSMFCLASINTNLENKADVDRLTKLEIRVPADKNDPDVAQRWKALEEELHKIETDEQLPAKLLARALNNLPVILETVEVMRRAAASFFGSQRDGDQFGTLLAGCWCLQHRTVPEEWQADAMIRSFNWDEHVEEHGKDDSERALEGILSAKIRMPGSIGDLSVFELVRASHTHLRRMEGEVVDQKAALDALDRNGIKMSEKDRCLLFGTSTPNLKKLVEGASYVTDVRGQLLRLPGAGRYNDKAQRFNGIVSKCVSVPLTLMFDRSERQEEDEELPV